MHTIRPITALFIQVLLLCHLASNAKNESPYTISLTGDRHREQLFFDGPELPVQLCQLKQGEQYTVWAIQSKQNQPLLLCDPSSEAVPSFSFVADSKCQELIFQKDPDGSPDLTWISVSCTTCQEDQPFLSKVTNLSVSGGWTDRELIDEIFLDSSCFELGDITGTGHSLSKGTFSNGSASIDMETGIILSTGYISDATGPNNFSNTGDFINGSGADPDLEAMASAGLFDLSGISFEFVPSTSQISFDYVFASEEYCEFVGTGISDVFGFFITGPGINGGFSSNGENLAVIPGTNGIYVTIDSLNQNINSDYFVPNDAFCGAVTNDADIEFDGWTSVLTATANVIPCETYTIRLVIADVADGIYDSAVFLKGSSLQIGNSDANGTSSLSVSTDYVYEGCEEIYVTIHRESGDISLPQLVDLQILPAGTAEAGVDHTTLPSQVTIPAGEEYIVLPMTVYQDNIAEGMETIALSVINPCTCQNEVLEIQIADVPLLEVTLDSMVTCEGDIISLTPEVSGGLPGDSLTYIWSESSSGPAITITAEETELYAVTVSGNCGMTATATAMIEVLSAPAVSMSGGGVICQDDPQQVELMFDFSGQGPWLFSYTVNGMPYADTAYNQNVTVQASTPGLYEIQDITSLASGCPGTASGSVIIDEVSVTSQLSVTAVSCFGSGSITVLPDGGHSPYSYQWSTGAPDEPTLSGLTEGNYTVTVTDVNGCKSVNSTYLTAAEPIEISAVTLTGNTCTEPENGSIATTVTGGTGNYTYTWTGGIGDIPDPSGLSTGTYWVTVSDQDGCTATANATVPGDSIAPIASAISNNILTCSEQVVLLSGSGSSEGPAFTYAWNGPGITGSSNDLNILADAPGTYTLQVTNLTNGCIATTSVDVLADTLAPNAFASAGMITCLTDTVSINSTGSTSGAGIAYHWNGPGLSPADTFPDLQVTAPGTYTLQVTNMSNGCYATADALVSADTVAPAAVIVPPGTLDCVNSTVELDGSYSTAGPGIIYQWFHNNAVMPSGDSSMVTISEPGIYVLTITDQSNGCTATAETEVSEHISFPEVEATTGNQLSCLDTTATLSATVTGGNSGYAFDWSTNDGNFLSGEQTSAPEVNAAGTYSVVVTDVANGCTSLGTVTLLQDTLSPVVALIGGDILTCAVATTQLDGSATDPDLDLTLSWSTQDGQILSGETTWTPLVGAPGNYTLVVINNENGCTAAEAIAVSSDVTPPVADAGADAELSCSQSILTLQGTGSGNGTVIFDWSTTSGLILSGSQTANPVVNEPGSYQLVVTDTGNGCTATDEVIINENDDVPEAQIAPPGLLTCLQTELVLSANASTGPTILYEWTTVDGNISSGEHSLSPVINAPGTYVFTVVDTVSDCSNTASVTVDENTEPPVADAGAPVYLDCISDMNYLDGSGSHGGLSMTYNWDTSDGNILTGAATPTPGIDAPGLYQLTVVNTLTGCTDTDDVLVSRDEPTAETIMESMSCNDETATIAFGDVSGGLAPYLYSIDGGANFTDIPLFQDLGPGVYQTVVQDANGCEYEEVLEIDATDSFHLNIEPYVEIHLGDSYQVQTQVSIPASEINSVLWTPADGLSCTDCLDPVASPLHTTHYTLTVQTEDGCEATARLLLIVDKSGDVYVPNVFSPNDDGINDKFVIYTDPENVIEIKSFLVFSRWGETVYEYHHFTPNDPAYGWDGKHRSKPLDPAVFAWFAIVSYIDGREEMYKGDVTLTR